jgi:HMG (high mobility group) box
VRAKKEGARRTLSSYMIWLQKEGREQIKTANPTATFGEIGKLAGQAWRDLDQETKDNYNAQAKALKEAAAAAPAPESS